MTNKVEMWPAYGWTCDDCGRDNFERGVTPHLEPEEEQFLRDEMGYDDEQEGLFTCAPDEVTCPHCGAVFETLHWGEEEID